MRAALLFYFCATLVLTLTQLMSIALLLPPLMRPGEVRQSEYCQIGNF